MMESERLLQAILERLSQVIDPETGADVIRMRLIEDLTVGEDGVVSYKFRPSSPFCPLAIPISLAIQKAVAEVNGVTGQKFEIVGLAGEDEFMTWLKQALEDQ